MASLFFANFSDSLMKYTKKERGETMFIGIIFVLIGVYFIVKDVKGKDD